MQYYKNILEEKNRLTLFRIINVTIWFAMWYWMWRFRARLPVGSNWEIEITDYFKNLTKLVLVWVFWVVQS